MPVSKALEKSARAFSQKYSCEFDFITFESSVEEFTFLRPNGGWIDVYKASFSQIYNKALEKVASGAVDNLDGEAMLDDFEYMLIKPYVNESETLIKHKPYVGMDRIARLEYLIQLTKNAPQNLVELYCDKYKKGELSLGQMSWQSQLAVGLNDVEREIYYTRISGFIEALERVNKERTFSWCVLHPFKNNAEKRNAALMKKTLVEATVTESNYEKYVSAALEPYVGYDKVGEKLEQNMLRAREEQNRLQRINSAKRETLGTDGLKGFPARD